MKAVQIRNTNNFIPLTNCQNCCNNKCSWSKKTTEQLGCGRLWLHHSCWMLGYRPLTLIHDLWVDAEIILKPFSQLVLILQKKKKPLQALGSVKERKTIVDFSTIQAGCRRARWWRRVWWMSTCPSSPWSDAMSWCVSSRRQWKGTGTALPLDCVFGFESNAGTPGRV